MHPIWRNIHNSVTLFQKQNVGSHLRPRICLKRIVRQTNGSQKLGSLCNIFSYGCAFLIHCAFGCDKCNHTAGTHLIQSLAEKIIVYQKVIFIVPLIADLKLSERDITDCHIKKAVGKIRILKALYADVRFLIKLLCNSAADAVQFHTVNVAVFHAFGQKSQEIACAAGRLQDISRFKAHLRKSLINCFDNRRLRVKSGQRAFPCGRKFFFGQQAFQLNIVSVCFGKALRQTAPAYILRQNSLLLGSCQTVFAFQLFQKTNGSNIVLILFCRCACAKLCISDMIIPLFNPLLDGLRHLRQRLLLHHNMVFHKSKRLIPVNRKTCAFLKCGIPQRCSVPMDALNNKASAIGNNRLPDKHFHCFNPALIFNDSLGRIFFVRNFCFFISTRFRNYFFFRSVFSIEQRKLPKGILLQIFKAFPHTFILPVCGICAIQNYLHGLQNFFHFFRIG